MSTSEEPPTKENITDRSVSRRTLAAGAVWAVPAVTVATTVPAFAASPCVTGALQGNVCKYPGKVGDTKHAYMVRVVLENHTSAEATVTPTSGLIYFDSRKVGTPLLFEAPPSTGAQPKGSVTIGANGEKVVYLVVDQTGNSANESGRFEFKMSVTGTVASGSCFDVVIEDTFSATPPGCPIS